MDEIRIIRRKDKGTTNLTSHDFYHYFKDLYATSDIFQNEDVESNLLSGDLIRINGYITELDRNFSVKEIETAISILKRLKSPGADGLIA